MAHKLLFRLPGGAARRWVTGGVMGKAVLSVLVTVGLTAPSLAQEPVLSNDGMLWEGEAAAAANELDQDRVVLALDAARNLSEHSQLILPEPDADEIARRMAPTDDADRQAQQTGFTRTVAGFAQLAPSPAGTQRSSDGQDYVVSQRLVGSTGAVSMRLHFSGVHLPAGARLYVYSLDDDGRPKVYDSAWLGGRTSFWSHTMPGDQAVVEYHAPLEHGTTDGGPASHTVDQVVHNVVDIFGHSDAKGDATDGANATAADCHPDMCDNQAWREIGDGVVRVSYIRDDGGASFCSASLLNDRGGTGTPYIYTANHCISTESVASTVEVWYFYQRNRCSDNPTSNRVTRLGATLQATGGECIGDHNVCAVADFTLLRALRPPPAGAMLLGWSAANIDLNTPVTGIHHPRGSFKRIAFGNKLEDERNRHRVVWTRGISEPGSSGSALFIGGPDATSARVIGSLWGADSTTCDNRHGYSYYGKLSQAFGLFQPFINGGTLPDMMVDSVSVVNSRQALGVPFTINAVVKNGGTGASAATRLRYVRSNDSTITASDTELTTDSVGELASSASSQQSAAVSIPRTGTWWVGACVDTVSREAATANNCSSGVRITITPPVPDLTVDTVSLSDPRPAVDATFTINATVRNAGNKTAAATTLRYYRSIHRSFRTLDTEIDTEPVDALTAGASSSHSVMVSIADTGTWWVVACADSVAGETATTNNCSAAVQVIVTAPDLIVDSVTVSDATPAPGDTFNINATVRNQGTGAAAETMLHYYLSNNSTITIFDIELETDTVSGLEPNGSSQQSAEVSIANTGEYWVGACVGRLTEETFTYNNCSTGVQVTVTIPPVIAPTRPDLTVDTVNVTNAAPAPGASFTINATARNLGTATVDGTTLHYYRSADDTITRSDSELTTDPVSALAANATSSESAAVSIANTGTWWVGACVDPVSGETTIDNNCSSSVEIRVTAPAPTLPDMIVTNVNVSDATPEPGASFTINATVRNSGNGAAAATTLRYYRSANASITTTDTLLTTDAVGALPANEPSAQNASVSIPNTGTWWVGACVDPVNGETARNNNCSSGVEVRVTAPAPTLPDLTVTNVSVSDATPEPGTSFTINATVRNSGNAAAAATTLRYYRSADATITTTDTPFTTDAVGGLAANRTSQQSAAVSIPNTGTWWVGACVDPVSSETTRDNNCSSGVEVRVTAPVPTLPDLIVTNVSVSDATPEPSASFTLNATVRNSGNGAAVASTLRYYRSADATITTTDTPFTTDAVGGLAANRASPQNASVSIPNTGTWWVGACVDPVSSETARDNNCSNGVQVRVTAPAPTLPDLTVTNVNVSDTTPEPGASFTINATVRNSGNAAAAATTLRYYRSADATITTTDTPFTTDAVGALAANRTSQQSAAVSIPNTGTWWVGACVDPVSSETTRDNNCSSGVEVRVTAPVPTLPDLIVTNVSVSDATPEPGANFTINATVRNSGNGAAAATTLRYYRSADATITTTDTPFTTDAVGGLAANRASPQNASVSIPNTGTWWVGACVDPVSSETARDNNCSNGVQVRVTAPAPTLPDLTVTNVNVSDTTPEPGASFTINATVRNSGNAAAAATTLRYYRSADATITTTDTPFTTDAVGGLAANRTSQQSAAVSIPNTGTWWVGACVDPVSSETTRDNNCSSGVEVRVTAPAPTLPDLTVTNVSVSDATPEPGASFTINATVRNSGSGAAAATTLRYYRSTNNTITTTDTLLATDPVSALGAGATSSESAAVSIANTGNYWVGACVGTVNGEVARTNNCSTGVEVNVTAVTAPPVPAPTLPDLTVDSVSVSASTVESDVSFTITATVRNSGDGASPRTTLHYFRSADATITDTDTELTTDAVGGLAPGGASQESATVSITDIGSYWVGACASTVNGETETGNNCSDGVEVTVTAPALPDLTVDGISVPQSSVEAGAAFTINATVQNTGTGAATATTLFYYLSDDALITVADAELASKSVEALAADTSSQQSAEVLIADAGTYWIGACVAEVNDETAIDNNCSNGLEVTVTARPDNNNGNAFLPAIIRLLLGP